MTVRIDIDVVDLTPTPAVVLARKTGPADLAEAVGAGISRVRRAVAAASVPTAGPPFVRHLQMEGRGRVEIGLPLEAPHAVPTLRATILPGGRAAVLWHQGPRRQVRRSLERLRVWVEDNAEPTGDPWVWHWTETDPETRAQIIWPVKLP